MVNVLGIYTNHDLGACLLRNGRVEVFIEEERLNRIKHGLPGDVRDLWPRFSNQFGYFPWASVRYCLEAAGLGLDDLDAVVLDDPAAANVLPLKDRSRIIIPDSPVGGEHHYMHALSTFFASSFDRAAVLVIDGSGSKLNGMFEAESGYLFENRRGDYRDIFKNRYPTGDLIHSGLGFTYEYVTTIVGFVSRLGYLADAGKTMGLAPYGKDYADFSEPWFETDGFNIDFTPFKRWLKQSGMIKRIDFASKERALIQSDSHPGQYAADLAFKVQTEVERAMLHLVETLHKAVDTENLCLAGGVHLNSVANGLIARQGLFPNIFIQPAADDTGQALGLAYYGHQVLLQQGRTDQLLQPMPHAYGGRTYGDHEIGALIENSGLDFELMETTELAAQTAAADLAEQKFIGWFQGGSEVGPRALGHRSILADPRHSEHKDQLNARVKFREGFRPFAPSVLIEESSTVFDMQGESPYMLQVVPVRPDWLDQVPAITHVDGTARVQTVNRNVSPIYHQLISAFYAKTGVPVVLNTSFNLRGMPIVESPEDALRCFLYTDLDCLYLGRYRISQVNPDQLFLSLAPGWRLVVEESSKDADWREARFVHPNEKAIKVKPFADGVGFCKAINGERSLREICQMIGQEEFLPLLHGYAKGLLRAGVLALRVGNQKLPHAFKY